MATQFERYTSRDSKSFNTKPDSKSSKDTSGLDKDLKKYVESGVYSSSFAKKQQDSRKKDDKKKSSSSRSSRSSRSSNSSSSSLPKDSVFNKQLNEQPQSKAPTQEESEEASKRGITVSDLRDTTKTSSVRSRGDDRLQKDMSSVFKPQERPQSVFAPEQEKVSRPGIQKPNRERTQFERFISGEDEEEQKLEQRRIVVEPEYVKPKINIDFSGIEEDTTIPKVEEDIDRLKDREQKLKNKQEELQRDLDSFSTRYDYISDTLGSKEKQIKSQEEKLKAFEEKGELTKQEYREYEKLYEDYSENIRDFNTKAERQQELSQQSKKLQQESSKFNVAVGAFEQDQLKLMDDIEKLNEKLTAPKTTNIEKINVASTAGSSDFDYKAIPGIVTDVQTPKSQKVRNESVERLNKDIEDAWEKQELSVVSPADTRSRYEKKLDKYEQSFGSSAKDASFSQKAVSAIPVAFATATEGLRDFAFEQGIKAEKANKEGKIVKDLYASGLGLASGGLASFLNVGALGYQMRTGDKLGEDGLWKKSNVGKNVQLFEAVEAIATVGTVSGALQARKLAKGKYISQVDDILKQIGVAPVKSGSETRQILKAAKTKAQLFKPSARSAFKQLQKSTKGATDVIDFAPVGLVDDVTKTRRLGLLQDDFIKQTKRVTDSPVSDVKAQRQFTDNVLSFKRGKEEGVIIGDTVYGTLDLGKGAKISYQSGDDVAKATYRIGDEMLSQSDSIIPGVKTVTRTKFEVYRPGEFRKKGDDLFRTDFLSKQKTGAQFADDGSFRPFDLVGTTTRKTKISQYDIDLFDTPSGRFVDKTKLKLDVPDSKTKGTKNVVDDMFVARNDLGKPIGVRTESKNVDKIISKIDNQLNLNIGAEVKPKNKIRQFIDDLFQKPKQKKLKGLVEEEEVISRFGDSRFNSRSVLDDLQPKPSSFADDTLSNVRSSLQQKPTSLIDDFQFKVKNIRTISGKPKSNVFGNFLKTSGLLKTTSKINNKLNTFVKPNVKTDFKLDFKPTSFQESKFDTFAKQDFTTAKDTKIKQSTKLMQDFDTQVKSIQDFSYKPPKFDDTNFDIKIPKFAIPPFPGMFGSKSSRKRKKSKKGGFGVSERKLKKLYKEIGL